MTTQKLSYCLFVIVSTILCMTSGYPDGAPEAACDYMLPLHNTFPQNTTIPYSILISKTYVIVGNTVEVTVLADPDTFYKGILIKAVTFDDYVHAHGSFVIHDEDLESYQTLNCSNMVDSAVTHSDNHDKTTVQFTWTAPPYTGFFIFIATVVQEHSILWLHLLSDYSVEVMSM